MNGRSGRAPPPQRGISGPKISTNRFKNVDMRQENSNAVTRAALLNRIKEVQEAIQLLKLGAIKSGDVQSLRRAPNNIIISPPQPEDLANESIALVLIVALPFKRFVTVALTLLVTALVT